MASYVQTFGGASMSIRLEYYDDETMKSKTKTKTFANVKDFTLEADLNKVGDVGYALGGLVDDNIYTMNNVVFTRKVDLGR